MTKYIFKQTGEEVELEPWRWQAYYTDGSVIKQFDKIDEEYGEFHQFGEVDHTRVSHIKVVSDDPKRHYTVLFNPHLAAQGRAKLIYFYRNALKVIETVNHEGQIETTGEPLHARAYVFGYEQDGQKHLTMITPSGEVILTDNADRVELHIPTKEV